MAAAEEKRGEDKGGVDGDDEMVLSWEKERKEEESIRDGKLMYFVVRFVC